MERPTIFADRRSALQIVALAAVTLVGACGQRDKPEELAVWGLASDLLERQHQLKTLQLPPAVNRLDWLSPGLEVLIARGTSIASLEGAPSGLKALDLSYSSIASLEGIPESIEVLDASWTGLEGTRILPAALKSLRLAGLRRGVQAWPPTLESISLTDVDGSLPGRWPASLKSLSLTGGSMERLGPLPSGLRSLTLVRTDGAIEDLPDSLQELVLRGNADEEIEG